MCINTCTNEEFSVPSGFGNGSVTCQRHIQNRLVYVPLLEDRPVHDNLEADPAALSSALLLCTPLRVLTRFERRLAEEDVFFTSGDPTRSSTYNNILFYWSLVGKLAAAASSQKSIKANSLHRRCAPFVARNKQPETRGEWKRKLQWCLGLLRRVLSAKEVRWLLGVPQIHGCPALLGAVQSLWQVCSKQWHGRCHTEIITCRCPSGSKDFDTLMSSPDRTTDKYFIMNIRPGNILFAYAPSCLRRTKKKGKGTRPTLGTTLPPTFRHRRWAFFLRVDIMFHAMDRLCMLGWRAFGSSSPSTRWGPAQGNANLRYMYTCFSVKALRVSLTFWCRLLLYTPDSRFVPVNNSSLIGFLLEYHMMPDSFLMVVPAWTNRTPATFLANRELRTEF